MGSSDRRYLDDVPGDVEERMRSTCLALPDAYEESAWVGTRWRVRNRTFAHVLVVEESGSAGPSRRVVLTFRSSGEELETLRQVGHPFFVLGWGRDVIGLVIDESTDWDEVTELVTESFCVMAPKKLIAQIGRPDAVD